MEAVSASTEATDGARQASSGDPFVVMEPAEVPLARLRPPWQTADYARLNDLLVRERKAVGVSYNGTFQEFEQWQKCVAQQVGAQNVSLVTDKEARTIFLLPRPNIAGVVLESMLSDRWE